MVDRIKTRIKRSNSTGLFHDSREDVRWLGAVCNELIDKVNELVDKVNELEGEDAHEECNRYD